MPESLDGQLAEVDLVLLKNSTVLAIPAQPF